ncbi:hypothetical protein KUTeg_003396 [Tegillarca granosa]|uniref:Uncharacterized protein n=1 Tax=Tegillarca granosa TaxID=220873 RepID=A0ABQ9FM17_TEGGR|nr:hypothetical protein KUTeg_003396 [Tegillarca granosa]
MNIHYNRHAYIILNYFTKIAWLEIDLGFIERFLYYVNNNPILSTMGNTSVRFLDLKTNN